MMRRRIIERVILRSQEYKQPREGLKSKKIGHLHIAKTAGTSLREWFRSFIPDEGVFIYGIHGEDKLKNARLITGHFNYHFLKDKDCTHTFTILRDPIERIISLYRYGRFENSGWAADDPVRHLSFEEWINSPIPDVRNTVASYYLRIITDEWIGRAGIDPVMENQSQSLQKAISGYQLFTDVGDQGNLDPFFQRLNKQLGLPLPLAELKYNTATEKRPNGTSYPERPKISSSLQNTLRAITSLEYEIYNHFREREVIEVNEGSGDLSKFKQGEPHDSEIVGMVRATAPLSAMSGKSTCEVVVRNYSADTWESAGNNPYHLSYHWLDQNWKIVVFDGVRTMLPNGGIKPGCECVLRAEIEPPPVPGVYHLMLTLVQEGVGWLETNPNFQYEILTVAVSEKVSSKNPRESSGMISARSKSISGGYYFQHIPKTAGTSLSGILGTVFSKTEICPAGLWSQLLKLPENERDSYRLYSGHFYSYLDAAVSKPLRKFTFLRDPLTRTLSHYEHIMLHQDHYLHQRAHELGSLKAFLEDPLCRETIHNYQARSLVQRFDPAKIAQALTSSENGQYGLDQVLETTPWDRNEAELLAGAASALKGFDCLGIAEYFRESVELLFATFSWGAPGNLRQENLDKNKILPEELDDETRAALLELIRIDQEVYQLAMGKFTRQLAQKRGLGFPKFNYLVEGGGYRTGSTLQYNLVGTYLEKIGCGRRIGNTPPDEVHRLQVELEKTPDLILVTKTHHVVQVFRGFKNPTAWADLILAGDAKAMVTNREQSDVKESMIRKWKIPREELLDSQLWVENVANCKRWRELGAWEQEYSLIVGDPFRALQDFCTAFGIPFLEHAAVFAARATSKEEHRKIMATVTQAEWDPLSLLHPDHIAERSREAILLVAWGAKSLSEVATCIQKSPVLPGCDRILITDEETDTSEIGSLFSKIIRHRFELTGLLRKSELVNFFPDDYEVVLLLDSDTRLLEDISLGFEKALQHLVAIAPAPHYSLELYGDFGRIMESEGIPAQGQMQYNSGVIFMKNHPEVRKLLSEWNLLAWKYKDLLGDDQPLLSLAMEKIGLLPYALSRSFNYRGFGEPISGPVRVWHSHEEPPEGINQFDSAWPPRRAYPGRVESHPIN